jgi:hypothetical protein
MSRIPSKNREFLLNNKQVYSSEYPGGRWMTLKALRKAVVAGRAHDWHVVDVDFETGENEAMCVYCATGIEHPDGPISPITPNASGTLH